MSYKITAGIPESDLKGWLEDALKKYGLYENRGVNYSKADIAPIVMCTVVCGDKIFLAKRGYGLADAEGYWSTVNGFIDEIRPVKVIAQQEVKEELGQDVSLDDIKVGKSYTLQNPKERRRYIVFPCLVSFDKKPDVVLDREHTEFAWIKREELESFHILEDLVYAVDQSLKLRRT
jgi:8-oxo-dGTP pyrophosphatase MutT (NUDIX family)